MTRPRHRNRAVYVFCAAAVIALGLAVRTPAFIAPGFFSKYAGDALWAVLIFLGVGLLRPRWSTLLACGVAAELCVTVEVSQLYRAPWIDAIRQTRLGKLTLGDTFGWGDIGAYLAGIAAGMVIEFTAQRMAARSGAD
ncbi:MAG: DUF2809 domain-containing protein [Planctomycetia bacterium]|nr:DUF2809 domain-containing protein [Planctomycetia bacterium]